MPDDFKFHLALALSLTIDYIDSQMSYREYRQWREFFEREPFGFVRDDMRMALNSLYAVSPYAQRGKKLKIDDFLLEFKQRQRMTEDEAKEMCRLWANAKR